MSKPGNLAILLFTNLSCQNSRSSIFLLFDEHFIFKKHKKQLEMDGKHWGGFLENSSTFTSPFLLSFDDVEKLSKAEFVPASRNLKAENAMTTQMYNNFYFFTYSK